MLYNIALPIELTDVPEAKGDSALSIQGGTRIEHSVADKSNASRRVVGYESVHGSLRLGLDARCWPI